MVQITEINDWENKKYLYMKYSILFILVKLEIVEVFYAVTD